MSKVKVKSGKVMLKCRLKFISTKDKIDKVCKWCKKEFVYDGVITTNDKEGVCISCYYERLQLAMKGIIKEI